MDLIYHSGGESVMVPSSYKLAEMFGVARSTVLLALKKLREEGYLITQKGAATFTAPYALGAAKEAPLIGITFGQGDSLYYGVAGWGAIAAIGQELTENNFNVRLQANGVAVNKTLENAVNNSYLDAMVCILADPAAVTVIEKKMPVVTIAIPEKPKVGVGFSHRRAVEKLREILMRERRNNFLLLFSEHETRWDRQQVEYLKEGGFDFSDSTFISPHFSDFDTKLEQYLNKNRPDVVFCNSMWAELMMKKLRKKGIDTAEECRLVVFDRLPRKAEFCGYILRKPYEEAAKLIPDMLTDCLAGKKTEPIVIYIELIEKI